MSTNFNAWMNHAGLLSFNMPYHRQPGNELTDQGIVALRYLHTNNIHYTRLPYNESLFQVLDSQNQRVYPNGYEGNLYMRIVNNGPNTEAVNDDFIIPRLPLGEMTNNVYRQEVEFENGERQMVRQVIDSTMNNDNLEAFVFFHIYPDGRNAMSLCYKKQLQSIKDRLFHKDDRFRKDVKWIFSQFDKLEKQRLQYQVFGVANQVDVH